MCSSAMSNAPNGTALYCSAGISAALHIHSLMAAVDANSARQHISGPVTPARRCCVGRRAPAPREMAGRRGSGRARVRCLPAGHALEVQKAEEVVAAGGPGFGSMHKG